MPSVITDEMQFELLPHETLLEALERTGHAVEYQCRSGYCGACRVKLVSGHVSYDDVPMAFVLPDEILPCCCRLQTDVKIACRFRRLKPES